jgi:biopolymer transport protein ExbB/TolQ
MGSSITQFIIDSGFVGWTIMATGLFAMAITAERFKKLYIDFHIDAITFSSRIQNFIQNRKFSEALLVCEGLNKKPLARAFRTILQKADREEEALYQASDIALAENIPLFSKRLQYLSMLANVATLLGLLGTIHGLILSFSAVATADPTQKQALLAHGISVSMYTTALGLAVAIPAMIFFSILSSRQNQLSEELFEHSQKLVESLVSMDHVFATKSQLFPDDLHVEKIPPSPNIRAA